MSDRLREAIDRLLSAIAFELAVQKETGVCYLANIAVKAAELRAALAEKRVPLTEEQMYAVENEAHESLRRHSRGPRGQLLFYEDSIAPHIIRATERAHGIGDSNAQD